MARIFLDARKFLASRKFLEIRMAIEELPSGKEGLPYMEVGWRGTS